MGDTDGARCIIKSKRNAKEIWWRNVKKRDRSEGLDLDGSNIKVCLKK
jgi:hypothetical protein